jgi:DNA-binding MarR family transcriptional regulator
VNQREALCGDLERLIQGLFALVESEGLNFFADAELSLVQVRVTMLLGCVDEQPIGSVADTLGISVYSAGRAVEQLVELGIVDRRESPSDRRVKLVSLTAHGLEVIDRHVAHKRKAVQMFVDRLPADHVAALGAAIRPILAEDYFQPPQCSPERSRH